MTSQIVNRSSEDAADHTLQEQLNAGMHLHAPVPCEARRKPKLVKEIAPLHLNGFDFGIGGDEVN